MEPDRPVAPDLLSPGYRASSVAVVCAHEGAVLVCQRNGWKGPSSWQFPQGGIEKGETPRQGLLRELHEETGLEAEEVSVVDWLPSWISYRVPEKNRQKQKNGEEPLFGQQQAWFLLEIRPGCSVDLSRAAHSEFTDSKWIDPHQQASQVVGFKRETYQAALRHFAAGAMRDATSWSQLRDC